MMVYLTVFLKYLSYVPDVTTDASDSFDNAISPVCEKGFFIPMQKSEPSGLLPNVTISSQINNCRCCAIFFWVLPSLSAI